MGYPWETHGTSMGHPWDIHGASMGHPWDIHRASMGHPWVKEWEQCDSSGCLLEPQVTPARVMRTNKSHH